MYLYQFSMKKLPFGLTPDTEFFCPLPTHQEALNVINFALNTGEALIKLVGEVGTGKTLLCRLLLNQLEGHRQIAYIPYPKLSGKELKLALAKELGIRLSPANRDDQITARIQTRLINLNKTHGPVVLLIDEAQLLDNDALETLRLFTNLETEQQKLLQIVLFGQPELDEKLKNPQLRQIRQRIVFSYQLGFLTPPQVKRYIRQRLHLVGGEQIRLGYWASLLLHHYSRGVPRLINILCHKALLLAFGQNIKRITLANIMRSAKDTDAIATPVQNHLPWLIASVALVTSSSVMALWGLL